MLLRFVVSNFLSFAEEVEFNMFPGNFKIHKDHVYQTPEVDLLKTAAIYGANGSGKSNFVKALNFLRDAVNRGSFTHFEAVNFKLSAKYQSKPTRFEIEFESNNRYFAYGVSFFDYWVSEEWLFEIFPKAGKEVMIFERKRADKNSTNEIQLNEKYKSDDKERLRFEIYSEELVPAELFIWRIKERIEEAELAAKWFEHNLTIIFPNSIYPLVFGIAENRELGDFFNDFLSKSSTGMEKIDMRDVNFDEIKNEVLKRDIKKRLANNENLVQFTYNGREYVAYQDADRVNVKKLSVYNYANGDNSVEFTIDQQSDGSRRLLDLIPILYFAEKQNITVIIDEIERSLHPSLIKEFLELFLSKPAKGQLLFTTHESYLLDLELFRQDEIWFTEKNKEGATSMYSLSEFKPRYDLDIRKGYLAGRFGAIPFLGNLKELNWHHAEEQGI